MVPTGEIKIGEAAVGVLGFQGREGYLFALIDPTKRPHGLFADGYYPHPDFGYIWLREENQIWVASGSVSAGLVGDSAEKIDQILDFIADDLLAIGEALASRIHVVEVQIIKIESGEESLIFKGPL